MSKNVYIVDNEELGFEECPYLIGNGDEVADIMDRYALTDDELWSTGWIASVQNVDGGPFKNFEEIDLYCYDREKGVEYDLPEVSDDIKAKFVKEVNDFIDGQFKDTTLMEGNPVSRSLTWDLDSFLQDVAQMYGTIDYLDIMNFGESPSEEDIKVLKRLRRRFRADINYVDDDPEAAAAIEQVVKDVATLVKNKTIREDIDDITPRGFTLTESYWVDNKEIMSQLADLSSDLELEGFERLDSRNVGGLYYDLYRKRGEDGKGIWKAIRYDNEHAEVIDITYKQALGHEPMDDFDALRKKLGKTLLP